MVNINYGLPEKTWNQLQKFYLDHLNTHPICEICKKVSSVRITPLGKVMAACLKCIEKQRQELIDSYNTEINND